MKSLLGERRDAVALTARGVHLDRWWAVRGVDGKLGSGKTTRRFRRMPGLLTMASSVDDDGRAWVHLPDGAVRPVDDPATARLVEAVVGESVDLATERDVSHLDDGPVHVLTTSSLRWLERRLPNDGVDVRRFRPNVLLDTDDVAGDRVEETWIGLQLQIGDAVLRVTKPAIRCVMAAQAQEELAFAPRIVGELDDANELNLGVYAAVERPGTIAVGDTVEVV